jgi:hypothetical protein
VETGGDGVRGDRLVLVIDPERIEADVEAARQRGAHLLRVTANAPDGAAARFLIGCHPLGHPLAETVRVAAQLMSRVPGGPLVSCRGSGTQATAQASEPLAATLPGGDAITRALAAAGAALPTDGGQERDTGPATADQLAAALSRLRSYPSGPLAGAPWLAGLRIEQLIRSGIEGPLRAATIALDAAVTGGAEPERFADAANAFARYACTFPSLTGHELSRLLNYTDEYVTGAAQRPWRAARLRLELRGYDAEQRARLTAVVAAAPWLAWYITGDGTDAFPPVEVGLADAVRMLALLRPRRAYQIEGGASARRVRDHITEMRGRRARQLRTKYRMPEPLDRLGTAAERGSRDFDHLLTALERVYQDTYECRSALAALDLPDPLREACLALLESVAEERTAHPGHLLVLVDWPGDATGGLVMVNRSPDDVLPVAAGAGSLRLAPFVVDLGTETTTRFAAELTEVDLREPLQLRVVETGYPLVATPRGPAATDGPAFQGRQRELRQLAQVFTTPAATVMPP